MVVPLEIHFSDDISSSYLDVVRHIFEDEEFLSIGQYAHHSWTNRLMHSVNVSYLSWYIAGKLGCDQRVAARAGLLHDFCPYDFEEKTATGEHQAFYHPKQAAKNSVRKFAVNKREEEAILSHMFPLGPMPRCSEAWIITVADKICAAFELCHVAIACAKNDRVLMVSGTA